MGILNLMKYLWPLTVDGMANSVGPDQMAPDSDKSSLALLHSEWTKLHGVLALVSAIRLNK